MKIVIDIPRKIYEHIRADGGHGYFNIWGEDNRIVTKAVFGGTPLPEHHGRLIDADKTISKICGGSCGCYLEECGRDVPCFSVTRIKSAPTIIEGV